jgi:hypothetical protein
MQVIVRKEKVYTINYTYNPNQRKYMVLFYQGPIASSVTSILAKREPFVKQIG